MFEQEQEYEIYEDIVGNTIFKFKNSKLALCIGDLIHLSVLGHGKIKQICAVKDEKLLNNSLLKHYGKIVDKKFFTVLNLLDSKNNTIAKVVADEITLAESDSKSVFEAFTLS
ncbi:MAG: hypothetical protein KDK62_07505 [Chlamydiia bacterium]|nr:hypothetical protein [Chlamydiia bacterium]